MAPIWKRSQGPNGVVFISFVDLLTQLRPQIKHTDSNTIMEFALDNVSSGGSSVTPRSSILTSPSKTFDKRLSSHLSQLNNQSPLKNRRNDNYALLSRLENVSTFTSSSEKVLESPSTIQWNKLSKISEQIYSSTSIAEYGMPILCNVCSEYIAVGTSKQMVLLFSYSQVLLLKVQTENLTEDVSITTVSHSVDSTYMAVGYSSGHINLWDLKKTSPILSLPPVTFEELQFNGRHYHIAHLQNVPISTIEFSGTRHTSFISSDQSGMLILHKANRVLSTFFCRSRILYGEFKIGELLKLKESTKDMMLDFKALPIGSKKFITDEMQLIAYITPTALTVISTNPEVTTQVTVKNSVPIERDMGVSALVTWFPAVKDISNTQQNMPILAYCWSDQVSIVNVDAKDGSTEVGGALRTLGLINSRKVKMDEEIVNLQFLSKDILIALTRSRKLHFIAVTSLKSLKAIDLAIKQMPFIQRQKGIGDVGLIDKCFAGSIAAFKSNIFILEGDSIICGALSNWADVLLSYLTEGKYIMALEESKRQYEGDDDLPLLSLPDDDDERHELMRDYLIQIFKSCMKYLFSDSQVSIHGVKRITLLAIQVCLLIEAENDLYELLYEELAERGDESVFFGIMRTCILDSKIDTLSPSIMKAMVQYYIKENESEELEQLICLLDIRQLDVDLTLSLCEEFHLNEIITYVWTVLLNDYITPMIKVVKRIRELEEQRLQLNHDELEVLEADIDYIYPYISYVLTGRQFPSERTIPEELGRAAKLNIYYFLFNGSTIEWPAGSGVIHTVADHNDEPAFPYLTQLLKYNSESMLACINEAFEDEFLNDTGKAASSIGEDEHHLAVNRQYIMDVLLGVYNDHDSALSILDKIRFAVFVSRNYPKYYQFIRVADSLADEMIDLLCKAGCMYCDKSIDIRVTDELYQDCQLGLQALLSLYKPIDIETVIMRVERAGFYQVLFSLYQSEGRFIDILRLWIRFRNDTKSELKIELVKSVPDMISYILKESSNNDIRELYKLLHDNLETIVSADPTEIAMIVCSVFPELNADVVNFKNPHLKFDYLKAIFSFQSEGGKLKKKLGKVLKTEYLRGLVNQKRVLNESLRNAQSDLVYIMDTQESLKSLTIKIKSFVNTLEELDDKSMEILQGEPDIVVSWYIAHDNIQAAIDAICGRLKDETHLMLEGGYHIETEDNVWKNFNTAFAVLRSTKNVLSMKEDGTTLKERLVLQIVETCVGLFTEVNEVGTTNKALLDLYKRLVQTAFSQIMNLNQENPKSFGNVFNRFLDGSSAQITTLGDVRLILREIFISYTNNEKVLNLIRNLVDEDIYLKLAELEELKVVGRSSQNIECETCGKRIWGSKVGNQIYELWRDHKQEVEVDDALSRRNELIIFKCHHSFHRKCIENMGMVDDASKKCIICANH